MQEIFIKQNYFFYNDENLLKGLQGVVILYKNITDKNLFIINFGGEIFRELTATATATFTTDIFLNNGYTQNNCFYKPIWNSESELNYYFGCKSKQMEIFKKIFSNLQKDDLFYKKVCLSV